MRLFFAKIILPFSCTGVLFSLGAECGEQPSLILKERDVIARLERACKMIDHLPSLGMQEAIAKTKRIVGALDCRTYAESFWREHELNLWGLLDVSSRDIVELFNGFENITELNISGTRVRDLAGIGRALPNLKWLFASAYDFNVSYLSDISAISEMPNLDIIDLSYQNKIRSFAPLKKPKKLRVIRLVGSNVQHLNFVRCCALEHLDIGETGITDLRPLLRLPKLKTLDIGEQNSAEDVPIPVDDFNGKPFRPLEVPPKSH